jgi:adenylate cyclase
VGRKLAREAIVQSRDDPNTLGYAAHALALMAREYEVPIACMDRALQLNPNSANVLMRSGFLRTWISDADGAIDHFTRSIRLTPLDPQIGYHYIGLASAHLMKGDFVTALDYARRGARELPRWAAAWIGIAVASAHLGQQEESAAAVKQSAGLRAAGLPEG